MPKHLITLPSGAVLPDVTGLPEGYPFISDGKLYAKVGTAFELVGGGGGTALDVLGLPLFSWVDALEDAGGFNLLYSLGLETYSGTESALTADRTNQPFVQISNEAGGSPPFSTSSTGGTLVREGQYVFKSQIAWTANTGTPATQRAYGIEFTRTFSVPMTVKLQSKLRKNNPTTTNRLRVYVDGVENVALAKSNLDEVNWTAPQQFEIPAGTHTIRMVVDDPSTASASQTSFFETTGPTYEPATAPTEGSMYLDGTNLYVYRGGKYVEVGAYALRDFSTIYDNGAPFDHSPVSTVYGAYAHTDSLVEDNNVIIGALSRAVVNRDPGGYQGYAVVIGNGNAGVGESVAIGAETWVSGRSGIAVGPFVYAEGRDDVCVGQYIYSKVARTGTALPAPNMSATVSTTGGTLTQASAPWYVITAVDANGGETDAGVSAGPFTLSGNTSSVAFTITNAAGYAKYRIYRRDTSKFDETWYQIGEVAASGATGTTTFTDTGLPDLQLTRPTVNTTGDPINSRRVLIGYGAGTGGSGNAASAVAVGELATVGGDDATALGASASAFHNRGTAVGADAQTTKANQVVLGTSTEVVTVPGSGIELTSPNGTVYRLSVSDAGAAVFTAV